MSESTGISYEEQFIRDYSAAIKAQAATRSQPPRHIMRNYAGGQVTRTSYSFSTSTYSADADLMPYLKGLRARARGLDMNNPYAHKFFKSLGIGCIGENGIALQNEAKDPNGQFDTLANKIIEAGWYEWGREGNCEVTGKLSLVELMTLIIETVARDGEILVRRRRGWTGNKWRYALQLIEADHLDENYNVTELPNGNRIVMSVEKNADGRPVAYHLLKKHPGNVFWGYNTERVRVPAEEIEHIYVHNRVDQTRGVPWLFSSMIELNNIGGYREAAIINARVGAAKMGFYQSKDDQAPSIGARDVADGIEDSTGTTGQEGEYFNEVIPGAIGIVPKGWEYVEHDPTYPTAEFGPFNKVMLQGACAGMLSAYATITGDLESVNFSSIRSGKIDERDMYRFITRWLIRKTLDKFIYADWLELSLLAGALTYEAPRSTPLPYVKLAKFNAPQWGPRGFDWVDPEADIDAQVTAVNNGFMTRSQVVAQRHGSNVDFRDICEKLAEEKKIAEEFGLDFSQGKTEAAFKERLRSKEGKNKPPKKKEDEGGTDDE